MRVFAGEELNAEFGLQLGDGGGDRGGETFTRSAAWAMLPASPTAIRYSSWRRVNRSGIGEFRSGGARG